MRVVVSDSVYIKVENFYLEAMEKRRLLDEAIVARKITRLFDALKSLGDFPYAFPKASVNREWVLLGYRDFVHEDFHFAYDIVESIDGERIVYVCDAVHSYLLHE